MNRGRATTTLTNVLENVFQSLAASNRAALPCFNSGSGYHGLLLLFSVLYSKAGRGDSSTRQISRVEFDEVVDNDWESRETVSGLAWMHVNDLEFTLNFLSAPGLDDICIQVSNHDSRCLAYRRLTKRLALA